MRCTQLYRTVPHELGHHRHYRAAGSVDRYHAIPQLDREAAAHRYADELGEKLREKGSIPFDRIFFLQALGREGLKREWFE